jgi:hypothetical protein
MGPGLTETHHTPELLAKLALHYALDWINDDAPYPLTVPDMLSVPYSVKLDDLPLFGKGMTGAEFVQIVKDQYEQLRTDSAKGGRVMALEALGYLASQPDAWLTTSDDIAAHFRGRDHLVSGVSGGFHQYVSAAGNRSPKVIANAFRAGFHRIVHRALPTPVGSRDRVTR